MKLLNKINLMVCKGEYGTLSFNENDVIVETDKFRHYFELVADTVMSRAAVDMKLTNGGWIQINNTVGFLIFFFKQSY